MFSRGAVLVDGPLQPNVYDAQSHPTHEQSTLLSSEQIPSLIEDEDEIHTRQVLSWNGLPWWKRPSPYWVIIGASLGSIGHFALLAPKVAMYTNLACRVHRPEYVMNNLHSSASPLARESMTAYIGAMPVPHFSGGDGTPDTIFLPNSIYNVTSFDDAQAQSEPDSQHKCASDPVVQAVVARLSAVFMTAMGILSCLTTGWWGSLSDRSGRRVVLLTSVFGLLLNDVIIHVITAWFVDVLPGGYWFLLVGYLTEGLCGSMSAGVAVTQAYIADTTEPSTRSRYFALQLGLRFAGASVGPLLGGLLIHSTGNILSVFYFAAILNGSYVIFMLCIPESLTSARARGARLRWSQEKVSQASNSRVLCVLKSVTRFLVPLAVLLPKPSSDTDPLKRNRKDWNLFFVAMAYGLVVSVIGSTTYTFQYAAAQFNWMSEEISYFMSIVSATRSIFSAVILPLIIKHFKPSPIQLPSTPNEPLRGSSSRDASSSPNSAQTMALDQCVAVSHPASFDLSLARISAALETVTFLGMAVASTGALFTLTGAATSFSSGFQPAAQALALDIYTSHHPESRGEVGKLFGALSVVQALGSQIISPALYGFVYFNTVAVFPPAIMIVSTGTSLLAFALVLFVRIPSKPVGDRLASEHTNEEGNQEVGVEALDILVATED